MQLHRRDVVDKATAAPRRLRHRRSDDAQTRARAQRQHPARSTGTSPTSRQLLGAVADRILEPRVAVDEAAWSRRGSLRSARRCATPCCRHTDGAELVSASFAAGTVRADRHEILAWLTDAAVEAGIDASNADLAARTVLYYVLGFTADEQSRLQWDAAGALADGAVGARRRTPTRASRSGSACSSTVSRPTASDRRD